MSKCWPFHYRSEMLALLVTICFHLWHTVCTKNEFLCRKCNSIKKKPKQHINLFPLIWALIQDLHIFSTSFPNFWINTLFQKFSLALYHCLFLQWTAGNNLPDNLKSRSKFWLQSLLQWQLILFYCHLPNKHPSSSFNQVLVWAKVFFTCIMLLNILFHFFHGTYLAWEEFYCHKNTGSIIYQYHCHSNSYHLQVIIFNHWKQGGTQKYAFKWHLFSSFYQLSLSVCWYTDTYKWVCVEAIGLWLMLRCIKDAPV